MYRSFLSNLVSKPSTLPQDPRVWLKVRRTSQKSGIRHVLTHLGIQRNVAVLSVAILLLSTGEEMWLGFMPKYLQALGASIIVISVYGVLRDLLDAIYQYPGGMVTDVLGNKRSLILFTAIALAGYIIYFLTTNLLVVISSTVLVMSWTSLAFPATFSVIGESLPREKRSMGFAITSVVRRVPRIVAPPIGGALIVLYGIITGQKYAFLITIVFAVVTIFIQRKYYFQRFVSKEEAASFIDLFKSFNPQMKRLLTSDILVRVGEGIPELFIVLYAIDAVKISALDFGMLTGILAITSLISYIPGARLSERIGRKPVVALTFVFFALFPLLVTLSNNMPMLIMAFVVGGLKEIGEPSRKAMIVNFSDESRQASSVGIYYTIRNLAVAPTAFIGGLMYAAQVHLPFYVGFIVAISGIAFFALAVQEP